MSKVEDFLTHEEEHAIVRAILEAEKNTSGEIRVHIEAHTELDHYQRARDVFHYLKMDNTREGNGVLIYIAVHDKKFAVLGDKGIDKVVPENFWNTTKNTIQLHFQEGKFKQGIIEGILTTGKALEKYFPWRRDDVNELSNEISKG